METVFRLMVGLAILVGIGHWYAHADMVAKATKECGRHEATWVHHDEWFPSAPDRDDVSVECVTRYGGVRSYAMAPGY